MTAPDYQPLAWRDAAEHAAVPYPGQDGMIFAAAVIVALMTMGCSAIPPTWNTATVACELAMRTPYSAFGPVQPGMHVLPPDVGFEDALTEDEAITAALANNSNFQAALAQLGIAHGDVVQAQQLANPNFSAFIPVGVKQWEWTLFVPIEALLVRPERLRLADSDYQRLAQELVQNGLTLVRDVRFAYTDLALATEQARLAKEAARLRERSAELTDKRFARGDISGLEATTARIDALNAGANAALVEQNVVIARSRLATLIGLPFSDEEIHSEALEAPELPESSWEDLVDEALASRPDVWAAQWRVEAAAHRLELARWQFLRLDAVADANSEGFKGYETGPGVRVDIPIWNRNQGGILRAEAELQQALHTRDAVHDQIVNDVRVAIAQWRQARGNVEVLRGQVVPKLKDAVSVAQKGFDDGGVSYLLVLQTTSQYLDAKTRMLDQVAMLRRAHADLERAVGRSLSMPKRRASLEGGSTGATSSSPEWLDPPVPQSQSEEDASLK